MKKLLRMFCSVGLVALLAVAMTGCGGGGDDDDDNGTSRPVAPLGISAVFNNATTATVEWTPVADATSYKIYYSDDEDFTLPNATGVEEVSGGTTSTHRFESEDFRDDTTPSYFVVTAVNAGGEGDPSLQVSAKHTTFSSADLEGDWYVTMFYAGEGIENLRWLRMKISIADGDTGIADLDDVEIASGPISPPYDTMQFDIDANGVVTQADGYYPGETSYNVMASNKDLIIGTDSLSNDVRVIRIFQRVRYAEDPLFTDGDLFGKDFTFHQLTNGSVSETGWMYGAGAVDGSGVATLTSLFDRTGVLDPTTDSEPIELDIDGNGVVTSTDDTNFKGFMSRDRSLIIGTTKDGVDGPYRLKVIQLTDPTDPPTFTMGDLAGAYKMASLFDGDSALWQRGTMAINSSGTTELTLDQSVLGGTGGEPITDIDPITLSMTTAGIITAVGDVNSFHGAMSATKDLLVSTYTLDEDAGDSYGLSLAVK